MCHWRLRRIYRIETSRLKYSLLDFETSVPRPFLTLTRETKPGYILGGAMLAWKTRTTTDCRALHELERLQKARAGESVPAPVVADLMIDSPGDQLRCVQLGGPDA